MKKNQPTPAKKIAKKKRRWYFRSRGVKKTTVQRTINAFGKQWRFSGASSTPKSRVSTVSMRNFSKILPFPIGEDISQFDMLGALDLFVVHKLLSRRPDAEVINLNKRFDSVRRIATLKDPIIQIGNCDKVENYHYLCLEREPQFPDVWKLRVRSRRFIQNNRLDHPYHFAGQAKK